MKIAAIDIGSPKKTKKHPEGKIGWALSPELGVTPGHDLDECIWHLAKALLQGPVALGFEAPMYVPMRDTPEQLTSPRCGEAGKGLPTRPFSAGPGTCALVTSLVVIPYVLYHLKTLAVDARATLDWRESFTAPGQLLLYEAFVTNQKNSARERDQMDAALAVAAFNVKLNSGLAQAASDMGTERCFNLLGAMMLRTGWTKELSVLEQECLVVKA